MNKLICLFAAVIILNNCMAQKKASMSALNNQLTAAEKSSGWKLLFDGKTTNGWHGYGRSGISEGWKIGDGIVMLEPDKNIKGRSGIDMVTDEEYGNFDLKLDWKIGPKGNSGMIFYIQEDTFKYKETYNTGLEMQVLDNGTSTRPGHPDGRLYTHRAGDLYDLVASKEAIHPQGEWNHAEVISNKGKLDFYMNGVHTLSTTLWDENWKQMVAISKFKDMPNWGNFKKGKISLQDHGEEVAFKNIKIKRL
ncbi:MAG: DUF1080 domain-containing protein [Ginsengibacter sp.]